MLVFFQNIAQTILSVIAVLVKSDFGIFNTKSQSQSEPCLILANGPSLKFTLFKIEKLGFKGQVMCVNQFSSSDYFEKIKPPFYVLLDPAFTDIEHEAANRAIDNLIKKTEWPLQLLMPASFKKNNSFQERITKNKNLKAIYFNYTIAKGFDFITFWLYRKNLAMPQSQNVLMAAIFSSILIGFKKVYISGADHSWHEGYNLSESGELSYIDTHFYGEKQFELGYFVKKNESFLAQQFISLHKVFKGYEIINKFAKVLGAKIFNVSEKSYIDVFEKIKFEDI
jgi:hypothetical protein